MIKKYLVYYDYNYKVIRRSLCFWNGLGLRRPKMSYQKLTPAKTIYEEKKTSKSAKYSLPLRYKKDPLK